MTKAFKEERAAETDLKEKFAAVPPGASTKHMLSMAHDNAETVYWAKEKALETAKRANIAAKEAVTARQLSLAPYGKFASDLVTQNFKVATNEFTKAAKAHATARAACEALVHKNVTGARVETAATRFGTTEAKETLALEELKRCTEALNDFELEKANAAKRRMNAEPTNVASSCAMMRGDDCRKFA